jgi:Tfp pilus assembly protein PilF
MLARPAVLLTPSYSLLVYKQTTPVTSLESTLVQVFILKHFKPPGINTYEKGGRGGLRGTNMGCRRPESKMANVRVRPFRSQRRPTLKKRGWDPRIGTRNVGLDPVRGEGYASESLWRTFMQDSKHRAGLRMARWLLPVAFCFLLGAIPALGQDSSAESNLMRGDRAELAITVRDSSGEPISAPAIVKVYRAGVFIDQGAARKGRAFFILNNLGDYAVEVSAPGYDTMQKEVAVPVALRAEVDVYLKRVAGTNESAGVPGRPQLAPKAKEAFDKGLQALSADKLKDAEKYVGEAMQLAPGHPDVLYLQGVLDLKRHNWASAQSVLEKATQIDPNHARAFAALGMTLSNQGKYDAAIPPLERSLQLDAAGAWETHWTLGKAYYQQGRYDEALKMSQQALAESNGKAPEVDMLAAQSLVAVGRYEDSARVLREFLKNHGDRPEAANARRWLERLTADGKIARQ